GVARPAVHELDDEAHLLACNRGRVRGLGDREVRPRRAGARRELEIADPRAPIELAGDLVVLLRVPERAVVDGVDGHVAVIALTVERTGLAAASGEQCALRLPKRARWIARKSPCIPN